VSGVEIPYHRRKHNGEIELSTFVGLGLVDDVALLIVEREPGDVYRTVTDRQVKLAGPQAVTVGVDFHITFFAARYVLPCTSTQRHCHNIAEALAIGVILLTFSKSTIFLLLIENLFVLDFLIDVTHFDALPTQ